MITVEVGRPVRRTKKGEGPEGRAIRRVRTPVRIRIRNLPGGPLGPRQQRMASDIIACSIYELFCGHKMAATGRSGRVLFEGEMVGDELRIIKAQGIGRRTEAYVRSALEGLKKRMRELLDLKNPDISLYAIGNREPIYYIQFEESRM